MMTRVSTVAEIRSAGQQDAVTVLDETIWSQPCQRGAEGVAGG